MLHQNIEEKFTQVFEQNLNTYEKTILHSKNHLPNPKKIAAKYLLKKKWLTTIKTWKQRASQRKHLAQLDQHLLDDIGLTKEMVAKEIKKPFWK